MNVVGKLRGLFKGRQHASTLGRILNDLVSFGPSACLDYPLLLPVRGAVVLRVSSRRRGRQHGSLSVAVS